MPYLHRLNNLYGEAYFFLLLFSSLITGCSSVENSKLTPFIIQNLQAKPSSIHIHICEAKRCKLSRDIELTTNQWEQLKGVFKTDANNSEHERLLISKAVALLEKLVGMHSAIWQDKKKNSGQTTKTVVPGQLDCNAEAVNTTNFLQLMYSENLIKYHQPLLPTYRGFSQFVAPHFTAVIQDTESGINYAVDSWFHENGKLPEIVELEDWMSGYYP